ncbi:hypothetical protein JAAARDRAFT_68474 [Jaapia argillacea MUCL 33604]|uniref:DRBM domain-containing protein n=1 Tax=Jaapia argillacea MUCL 33604 TaxID=933084 RepID=A0A067Q1F5_9AGAM|nr:hypothetical protein JAAARDRAFT_68474 [Jaapia argillacea MUCL 33604]
MAARREESVGMRADETGATSGRTLEVPNSRKIQRRVLARDIPSDNDKSKFRISLNNLLKYRGQAEKLSWKEIQTGPHHSPVWTVTAYMEDEWYVSGTGITRSDAKEAASREALARMFSWESEFTGPPHAPLWTAIAILDDVMYAQGSGRSRQAARKVATDVALANVVVKYGPSP